MDILHYLLTFQIEKTHKILVHAFLKITIFRKTKSFDTFWIFFLDSMDLWHYQSKYSKRFIEKSSLQIIICSLLQAKHLMITQEKNEGVEMILSYRLQQNVSVELHMI